MFRERKKLRTSPFKIYHYSRQPITRWLPKSILTVKIKTINKYLQLGESLDNLYNRSKTRVQRFQMCCFN
jgi:hypothetical protein